MGHRCSHQCIGLFGLQHVLRVLAVGDGVHSQPGSCHVGERSEFFNVADALQPVCLGDIGSQARNVSQRRTARIELVLAVVERAPLVGKAGFVFLAYLVNEDVGVTDDGN